jgi:hypothetical protein
MSALPPKADMCGALAYGRFWANSGHHERRRRWWTAAPGAASTRAASRWIIGATDGRHVAFN